LALELFDNFVIRPGEFLGYHRQQILGDHIFFIINGHNHIGKFRMNGNSHISWQCPGRSCPDDDKTVLGY
jgi:hypothetical protein